MRRLSILLYASTLALLAFGCARTEVKDEEFSGFLTDYSDFTELESFLLRHRPLILNVAGPRASEAPGIEEWVEASLDRIFPRVSKS